jgi:uncharacterized delta-60 repeat protein
MATPLWLQRLRSILTRHQRAGSHRKIPPRARLRLEALEDRCTPSAGALDPTFGNGGIVTTNLGSPDDEATNIFVQPDGKLLVVGFTQDTVHNDYALILSRYQASGSLDTTYGTGGTGTVITGLTSPNPFYPFSDRTFAFQSNDDSLVILWGNEVTRYKSDGSLDTGFGTNGIVTPSGFTDAAGNPTGPNALALQSNGQILLAGGGGGAGYGLPAHAVVERLNSNGSLDTNFGQGGTVAPDLLLPEESFYSGFSPTPFVLLSGYTADAVAALPNGGFVIGGSFATDRPDPGFGGLVARFNADGSLDTTFGLNVNPFPPSEIEATVGGKVLLDNDPFGFGDSSSLPVPEAPYERGRTFGSDTVTDITVQPDGNLLLGLDNGFAIVRLTQSGMLDPGFISQHYFFSNLYTGIAPLSGPLVFHTDASGGILVMPFSPQDAAGNFEFAVNRYNRDGTPDLTFGSDGSGAAVIDQSASSYSDDFAVQSDGKIVLAGATWDANKQGWDMELMRLQSGAFNVTTQAAVTSQVNQMVSTAVLSGQPDQVTFQASSQADVNTMLAAINALAPASTGAATVTVTLDLGGGSYSTGGVSVNPPAANVKFVIQNGTLDPSYPALTVAGGQVTVLNCNLLTTGDAPTILVTGGSLTLRNDVIKESTGDNEPAISVTGGTVDLGTSTDQGGNTIDVNGSGTWISNTTANPVSAVGDTFEINGQTTAWPVALTVTTSNSLMLVGSSPPPLTGTVNGTPFTGTTTYTTAFGDTVTVMLGTAATSASSVGQYPTTAILSGPDRGNYVMKQTAGTMYVVSLGTDPTDPTHVESVVFWDNNHNAKQITLAELSSLDSLNLVDGKGNAFDPGTLGNLQKDVNQLQQWLQAPPKASTAYQLSVQLAVTDLNVLAGYVNATDLVYAGALVPYASAYGITGLTSGGFIDVQSLMNAANAVLGQVSPGTPDPNQAYEAALTQVLQSANLNNDFVSQEVLWGLTGTFV